MVDGGYNLFIFIGDILKNTVTLYRIHLSDILLILLSTSLNVTAIESQTIILTKRRWHFLRVLFDIIIFMLLYVLRFDTLVVQPEMGCYLPFHISFHQIVVRVDVRIRNRVRYMHGLLHSRLQSVRECTRVS